MKRWSHAHTLGVGALVGVLLATHVWTLLVCTFLAGLFLGRFWNWLVMVEEALRLKWFHQRKKPITRRPPKPPSSQVGPHDPWPGEQF